MSLEDGDLRTFTILYLLFESTKNVLRLILGKGLSVQEISQKYISPSSIEYWIRSPLKSFQNGASVWTTIVKAFHLIDDWLTWKVRNGHQIHLGEYLWVGCKESYRIPTNLIESLHDKVLLYLSQVAGNESLTIWIQEWKNVDNIGFSNEEVVVSGEFISKLK